MLLDQIRAVDKMRLAKKLGILDNKTQVKLCDSLHELFVF
ncbi:MAG: type II toxin-antitoxin system PemK/MazF family toxin [Candidatus Methanofishera endochildressiae]|uniref:Type II toxin-antitoxin system PemK/MazF family toxin n=1 Tax=Candidatus Methanofishera endochildressiae TaxID=2738884 RepID=A0A7Z0MNJ5_9GAMM|nr:type II toxin-antitoxin system PemK/MazF family toxin [Candidatus Methanofishera endochildressiae]